MPEFFLNYNTVKTVLERTGNSKRSNSTWGSWNPTLFWLPVTLRLNPKTLRRSLLWLVRAHMQLCSQQRLNHTLTGRSCWVLGRSCWVWECRELALEGWVASPLSRPRERSTQGQGMGTAGEGVGLRWARFWGVGRPRGASGQNCLWSHEKARAKQWAQEPTVGVRPC